MLVAGLPSVLRAQEVSATVKVPMRTEAPPDTVPDIPEKAPYFSHRRLVVQYDSRYSIINSHFYFLGNGCYSRLPKYNH